MVRNKNSVWAVRDENKNAARMIGAAGKVERAEKVSAEFASNVSNPICNGFSVDEIRGKRNWDDRILG
jgi:hypothetical protein